MIVNLRSLLTRDNSSLWEAASRLMVLSDDEYIKLAYILRKIIRECDYNTETQELMFRGFNIIYDGDCEVLLILSKLISKEPYQDINDAKQKVEKIIK